MTNAPNNKQEYRHVVGIYVDKDSLELFSRDNHHYPEVWRRWVEVAWGLMEMMGATPSTMLVSSQYGGSVWNFAQLLEAEGVSVPCASPIPSPVLEGGRLRLPQISDDAWNKARALMEKVRAIGGVTPVPKTESLVLAMAAFPPPVNTWSGCIARAIHEAVLERERYYTLLFGNRSFFPFPIDCWWEVASSLLGWQYVVGKAMYNFSVLQGKVTIDKSGEGYYAILGTVGDDNLSFNVWIIVPKTFPQSYSVSSLSSIREFLFYNENVRKAVSQAGSGTGRLIVL